MAATEQNPGLADDITMSGVHAALVTPSDSAELTYYTRGLSFTTNGPIKVVTMGGETLVIPAGALAAGVVHPLRVKQIYSTGTAVGTIVAYW